MERGKAGASSPHELGMAATSKAADPSIDAPAMPAPSLRGVADVAERARVFEALFQAPSEPLRLGRYVILGTLGTGGMGRVLEAFDRTLDRRVAVKVLHRELGARHHARLVREARALAKLSHPHVVQVYEVGEAEGEVFVAMELVHGRSLADWIAQDPRPGWREAVRVYVQAGEGLAAAHAEGLVHRDFKPSNAVIDDKGRVRVLDFGLARLSVPVESGDQAEDTRLELEVGALASSLTGTGAVVGTLAYMPPEQMRGKEADARSDQFSFCVALYEAVYGERPFQGRTMEALALALEVGKVRPAPKGASVPEALRKLLLHGLAIDARERWPSMDVLLAELRRLVAPRRAAWWVLGVTGGLAAVGVGLAQYAEVGFRCEGAEAQLDGIWDEARKQAVKDAMLASGRSYAADTWDRVEPRLDGYAAAWTSKHEEVCEATRVTQEQTEDAMGLRMGCLQEHRTALRATVDMLAVADDEVVEKAVELVGGLPALTRCDDVESLAQQRQRVPPPEDPEVARQVEALRERLADVEAERAAGKLARALEHVEPCVREAEALGYAPLVAEAKQRFGRLLGDDGRYDEAEHELEAAYALAVAHGHDKVALTSARTLTGLVGSRRARPAEGLVWGATARSLAEHSGDPLQQASSAAAVGSVLFARGEYEPAKLYHRRALEALEAGLGPDDPAVAEALGNLGNVVFRQGDYEQALLHHQRALQIREQALGPEHPAVAKSLNNMGNASFRRGEYQQAELHHRRALEIQEQAFGPDHLEPAGTAINLGIALAQRGDHEQAESYYRRALRIQEQALGADHPMVAVSLYNLGSLLSKQGDYEQAESYHRRALRIRETKLGTEHADVAASLTSLGSVLERRGQYEQAELSLQRSLRIKEAALGADHPSVAYSLVGLVKVALAQGQLEPARAHAERLVSIREQRKAPADLLAEAHFLLAQASWPDGSQRARARRLAEAARDALAELGDVAPKLLAEVEQWLAEHPSP